MTITTRQKQLAIGAFTAAVVAVVTYLLGQGAIDPNIAVLINAVVGGIGGATAVKS